MHLDEACDLRGTLRHRGDVFLSGSFEGSLEVAGCLQVAAGATVRGTVVAGRLEIDGVVDAAVVARDGVWLGRDGQLRGGLETPRLQTLSRTIAEPADAGPEATRSGNPTPDAFPEVPASASAPGPDVDGDPAATGEGDQARKHLERLADQAALAQAGGEGPVGVLHRRRRPSPRPMVSAAGR